MSCGVVLVVLLLLASRPGLAGSSGPGPTRSLADPDPAVPQGEAVDVAVLWDHLRSLKDLVLRLSEQAVAQRLVLRSMETRVQDQQLMSLEHSERIRGLETLQVQVNATRDQMLGLSRSWSRIDDLEEQNSAQDARLEAQEAQVDHLENKNTELGGELPFLEMRLRASESTLEQLRRRNAAQETERVSMAARLTTGESQREALESRLEAEEAALKTLKTESSGVDAWAGVLSQLWVELHTNTSVMASQMDRTERRLDQWMSQNQDPTRVAFAAGLSDSGAVGPFGAETTLVFSKTLTNIGQAYNQTTGIFRAPVRGLYCFLFTVADFLKGYRGVYLYRNAQQVLFSLELNGHGGYASSSTAVPLLLESGDTVCLRLPGSYRLYDDNRNFSLFSGFLLFPL
ncbi:unnamed protein product [Lota lota]